MEPTDITVKILTEIRDSIHGTNSRLDSLEHRLDTMGDRIVEGEARTEAAILALGDRIVEAEVRTATKVAALGGTLEDVKSLLRDRLDLRDRVDRCEQDIQMLKDRTGTPKR